MSQSSTLANIKLEPMKVFWGERDLGFTEGDIEISLTEEKFDVSTHQQGSTIPEKITTGRSLEFELTISDFSSDNIAEFLQAGDARATAAAEVTDVTCVADTAGSLDGLYFNLYSANDATAYYVWMNVDAGGNDPAPAGKTAIPVAISSGDSADAVATAVAAAVGGNADFGASASGAVVTITNAATGGTTDASDPTSGGSTFSFSVTTQGISEVSGWGSSKDFINISSRVRTLRLHPVALADSDRSRDLSFWCAYPNLSSMKFSSESNNTMTVSWDVIPDGSRDSVVDFFAYGDSR